MNDDAMPADIQFMPTPSDADLVANYGVLMSEIIPVGDPAMADRDGRADGRARRDDPDPNDFSLEAEGQREQNELDALEDADVDEDALLAPPVLTTTTPAPRARTRRASAAPATRTELRAFPPLNPVGAIPLHLPAALCNSTF